MSVRTTLVANEVWLINPSRVRVTMVTNEIWVTSTGFVRVTSINLQVWRTVAGAPLTITGHADGYAICSRSIPVVGNADGYATAAQYGGQFPAPLLAFMGI